MNVNLNVFSYSGAYYEELVDFPPDQINFCGIHRIGDTNYVATPEFFPRMLMFLEAKGQKFWETVNYPSLRPALRGEIVHSNRLPLTAKPYVVSFDHVGFLTDFDFERLYRLAADDTSSSVEQYLNATHCHALLPWSEAAANGFNTLFGELSPEIEVLYPAVRPYDSTTEQSTDTVELLFVATNFYLKGGMEVLELFSQLRETHDVRLTMIADVPSPVRRQYDLTGISIEEPNFSRETLYEEFYSTADVLLHPTHNDSFGMVLLEAMNAGLPIVSTDMFAIPEIVDDGTTGLLVDQPEYCLFHQDGTPNLQWDDIDELRSSLHEPEDELVRQLYDTVAGLVEDYDQRVSYGEAGKERIVNGRFSIEHRNARLAEIYRVAATRTN